MNQKTYYEYDRPEIQEMVNSNSNHILDVGCASGKMAGQLKERLDAEVWGIEYVESVAREAKNRLDKVYSGDVFENLQFFYQTLILTVLFLMHIVVF